MVLRGLIGLAALFAEPALADITSARYTDPTDRYDHGILGDAIEWGALEITMDGGRKLRLALPDTHVFEDIAPRLIDVDQDGNDEVVVIETNIARGARLAIYDEAGLVAATPNIGRTHRWLAPVGAADLDGDGLLELAYIDRPHLAKTLLIWRFDDGALTLVGEQSGLTNHRIGEGDIAGGIRTCGGAPEMITADANWRRLIASTFENGVVVSRDIGAHAGRASFAVALSC